MGSAGGAREKRGGDAFAQTRDGLRAGGLRRGLGCDQVDRGAARGIGRRCERDRARRDSERRQRGWRGQRDVPPPQQRRVRTVVVASDAGDIGAQAGGRVRLDSRRVGGQQGGAVHGLAVLGAGDVRYRCRVEPGARLRRDEHERKQQALGAASVAVRLRGHWKVVRPDGGSVKLAARYIPNRKVIRMAKPAPAVEVKVLARNKRARHEYHVDETLEAGLVLAGSEVKSIRAGKVTLVDAFADIDKGEAWLHQMEIGVYAFSHGRNHEPRRKRKLLLHRREIDRLVGKIREKSYTLVPLSLYEKKGRVKAEIALVYGKQSWDKREDVKKRESQREIDRAMASRRR